MPRHGVDGGADRLLDMLGHPPVVLLFEIADCDDRGAATNGEFGLGGGPADKGGGAVDAQEDEGWFVAGRGGLPDECVTVWYTVSVNHSKQIRQYRRGIP